MAKHTWTDGEVISAALMNDLETRAQNGADGAMSGSATSVTKIATPESATAQDAATTINALIDALVARGIIITA